MTMMKKRLPLLVLIFCASAAFADERPLVPSGVPVSVQYQMRSPGSNSWTSATATLRDAVSESMMTNELSRRHPHMQIRILSAGPSGKKTYSTVRFQTSRDGKSWTTGTTTVENALSESMARHQIERRFPNMQVRILGMTPR